MQGRAGWGAPALTVVGAFVVALLVLATGTVLGNLDAIDTAPGVAVHSEEPATSGASQSVPGPSATILTGNPTASTGDTYRTGPGELLGVGDNSGEYPPGSEHHHHGAEHGATSSPAISLARGSRHVAEGLPAGYLGSVRAAGGRGRPD